jgi:flagellar biosynthesis protein FlhA
LKAIGEQNERMTLAGQTPICLCSPNIRLALKRLTESAYPQLVVLSYNEINNNVEVISNGTVRLENGD